MLVILDLDETLIHASEEYLGFNADFTLDKYFIYKRPYLDLFLHNIAQHYKIGIWSSADDVYVSAMVKNIQPQNVTFEFVWGRSKCSLKKDKRFDEYYYEKRLDKLKKMDFQLEKMLIVDDSPEKSRTNYGNAINIKAFTGNQKDEELLFLQQYLLTFKDVENVRTMEKRNWRKEINHI